jgi:hypothetical protein
MPCRPPDSKFWKPEVASSTYKLCTKVDAGTISVMLACHLPWFPSTSVGTRVPCMNTIFRTPACFSRKADSSHF